MNTSTLQELKLRHNDYIARVRAAGRTILTYRAPCCDATLEGLAAGAGETWDTGATCPECGVLYFKESTEYAITGSLPETAPAQEG